MKFIIDRPDGSTYRVEAVSWQDAEYQKEAKDDIVIGEFVEEVLISQN